MPWFEKYILDNDSVFIIAEAGINHNGDLDTAKRLVDAAAAAGVDCVKFQTFSYGASESKHSIMPGYFAGREHFSTKKEWYDSIFLSEEEFAELKRHCEKRGVAFLSTACDVYGLEVLVNIGAECVKIASADVNNDYLLKRVGRTGLPVILSTGMSTIEEIDHGVQTLRNNGTSQLAITHCTSQYPAPFDSLNLKAILTLKERHKVPVGFSDHTMGHEAAIAAVALGSRIIEKHFTLDRKLPGVDQAASIEPSEMEQLVKAVRNIEKALGDGEKTVAAAEKENAASMRRSLMAARPLKAGTVLGENDITAKRPGTGMPPSKLDNVLGKKLKVDMNYEDLFSEDMLR